MTNDYLRIMLFGFVLGVVGCGSSPPISTVKNVDLDRFMGDWYVIANIPTFIEKDAFNAVESYSLNEDGTVATTFRFREGSFTGEEKTYHPTGYVLDDQSHAIWGMQFFWPFKADYRIVFIAEDYSQTIIGRNQRDYIWIMARTPEISEEDFLKLLGIAMEQGYDITEIQKVPQQWNDMT
jgi:apolipoprotein D and lipocalin family protein